MQPLPVPNYASWPRDDLPFEAARLRNLARHVADELLSRTCPTAPLMTGYRPYNLFNLGELRHEKRRIAQLLEALDGVMGEEASHV